MGNVRYNREHRASHPELSLWYNARVRAKKLGVPISITPEDIKRVIPLDNRCPITRCLFERAPQFHPNSMSLDRVIPDLGYIQGNICVISQYANRLKMNCTDSDVFRRLAAYLDQFKEDLALARV